MKVILLLLGLLLLTQYAFTEAQKETVVSEQVSSKIKTSSSN